MAAGVLKFDGVKYLMDEETVLARLLKEKDPKTQEMLSRNKIAAQLAEIMELQEETIRGYLKPCGNMLKENLITAIHKKYEIPYEELGNPIDAENGDLMRTSLDFYLGKFCLHEEECKGCCELMDRVVSKCEYLKKS